MADVYKQSFKQNYTNNIELSIFNCGLERCAPGQTWGPGIRDHYLIHLVVSGKGTFEVGGKTFEVVPGDLFFARPSQLIRYSADEQQPWEYSWVGFNGACAHKLAAQLPFTDAAPVHHTQDLEGMRAALSSIYSSRGLQPQDEALLKLFQERKVPYLIALNKCDLLSPSADVLPGALPISAATGQGLDELLTAIEDALDAGTEEVSLLVPFARYALTDKLRRLGSVLSQEHTAEGVVLRWRAEKANVDYALREGAVLLETERK